jgi:hypothetical protein
MNPRRFVEQYPRSLEAQLLRAGRATNAPNSTLRLTLSALGLGAAATAASVSGAVHAKAWSLIGTVSVKWLAIGVLAASGALVAVRLAGWHGMHSMPAQPERTRAAVTTSETNTSPAPGAIGNLAHNVAPVQLEATAAPRVTRHESPRAARKSSESLGAEVALIDAARQAVDEKQAARALALLQQYDRQFKKPCLAQEATLLRARAIAQLARASEAAAANAVHGSSSNNPLAEPQE